MFEYGTQDYDLHYKRTVDFYSTCIVGIFTSLLVETKYQSGRRKRLYPICKWYRTLISFIRIENILIYFIYLILLNKHTKYILSSAHIHKLQSAHV